MDAGAASGEWRVEVEEEGGKSKVKGHVPRSR